MKVVDKTEGRKVSYQVMMQTWLMLNNQMMVNLEEYEQDYDQVIDFYMNNDKQLTNTPARRYAAQIAIPARKYNEVEVDEESTDEADENMNGIHYEPVPFDVENVTLILWGLD